MFDGRRSRRGCLLPVAVALVVAMVCAFGSASTSATAETEETRVTTLKVTNVEKSVTGTAYKYMDVKGKGDQTNQPEQHFDSQVVSVIQNDFKGKNYVERGDQPTNDFRAETDSEERSAFADKLLSLVSHKSIELTAYASNTATSGAGDDTEISFTLPMGGYVIKLTNGSGCIYDPILADVWLNPNGNFQIRANLDLSPVGTINAKGQKITSTKTVGAEGKQKTHRQIGDAEKALTYKLEVLIPKYPANATNKKFGVQDYPDPGLTINPDSITVQIGEGGEKLTKSQHYSYDVVANHVANHADTTRGTGFKIEFKDEKHIRKLAEAAGDQQKLTVTYTGTLNDKASIKGGTKNYAHPLIPKDSYNPNGNKDFEDYADSPSGSLVASTTVYTYGVHLTKVDSGNKDKKLEGAQFKLYKNGSEVYVKQKTSGVTGMYVVQASSGGSSTITSNADGLVQIDGLDAGITYTLQETTPPAGYNVPADSMTKIMIRDEKAESGGSDEPDGVPDTGSSTINDKSVELEDNRLTANIENTSASQPSPGPEEFDFTLPKTGAMGTAVFSALGVTLVVTSIALVAVMRRRKSKRSS